jgi:ribonucleotide reductase alpha subunit
LNYIALEANSSVPKLTAGYDSRIYQLNFFINRNKVNFFIFKSLKDFMKNILQRWRTFLQKKSNLLSEILYVPSQTGSHDVGAQYLGDVASCYLEHQNLPEAGRLPFRGIKLPQRL